MRDFDVFAFDLDGTLTNDKKEITPETKKCIIELQKKGKIMVLASGRPLLGVLPLALELDFDKYGGYIICMNGAMIYNCQTKERILDIVLPSNYIKPLIEYSRKVQIASLSYDDEAIITEMPNDKYVFQESFNNKLTIKEIPDLCKYINFPIEKIMFVGEPDLIMSFYDDIKLQFPKLSIYRSMPYFLEIMNNGIDKEFALTKLLSHLNLNKNELIAFGDGYNDLPMLNYAGFSVVMNNASEEVKQIADFITLSNNDNGVSYVLNKVLRGEDIC